MEAITPSQPVPSTTSVSLPGAPPPEASAPKCTPGIALPLCTASDAAEILGWPLGEVYAAAERDALPAVRFAGSLRFDRHALVGDRFEDRTIELDPLATGSGGSALRVVDVAEALSTSLETVRFLIRRDGLPAERTGASLVIDREALLGWLSSHQDRRGRA